jgi:hypothetical protein
MAQSDSEQCQGKEEKSSPAAADVRRFKYNSIRVSKCVAETSNSKHQTPNKLQTSSLKPQAQSLKAEVWPLEV